MLLASLVGLSLLAPPTNLVANGGFEAPGIGWSGWGSAWTVDRSVRYSGEASARFRNAEPGRYELLTQPIAAKPGKRYRMRCRIKVDDIRGDDTGATMCLEWSDAKGAYLGGCYPAGWKGTGDWRAFDEISFRIPDGAKRVTATVYVRKGMTGTAWFDDVSVSEEPDPPFEGSIVVPGYRGVMSGPFSAPVIVRGWMGADDALPLSRRRIVAEIVRQGSTKAIVRKEIAGPKRPEIAMSLPTSALPDGRYTVRVSVAAAGAAAPAYTATARLVRTKSAPKARVWLRPDGVAMLGGKPFFPIGVFEGIPPSNPESLTRLREIASMGFNCVMNYGINGGTLAEIRRYLDTAHGLGLKVIYSLKDVYEGSTWAEKQVGPWTSPESIVKGVVRSFRDHPALLAWYLNDELPLSWHDRLVRNYRWVRDLDPDHPAWIVLYQVTELSGYGDTTDVMGVDPYPLPSSPLTMVSDWTRTASSLGMPLWVVPQLHDIALYDPKQAPHPPSEAEMRAMTWQALAHGANGLVFYSYFDLKRGSDFERRRDDVKRVIAEVKMAVPWLVGAKRGKATVQSGIIVQTWARKDDGLLVCINPSRNPVETDVEFSLGLANAAPLFGPPRANRAPRAKAATWQPLAVQVDRLWR